MRLEKNCMPLRALATMLLCSVVALAAQTSSQSSQAGQDQPPTIDWNAVSAESVTRLTEYVRINTTNPPGNESAAVRWFEKIFRQEGIPFETAESVPGRGSIVARLKGTGNEPALILLHHIDVVPVNREAWSADPFAAEIRDGYMWGRGTVDTKSLGIAELEAFLLLHRNHVPLRRDVIFLATADEEAGGEWGQDGLSTIDPRGLRTRVTSSMRLQGRLQMPRASRCIFLLAKLRRLPLG
jgi:hypothetical protein